MKLFDFVSEAAKREYKDLPEDIQDVFGFALYQVQEGKRPSIAKNYSGSIEELKETDDQNKTYRAVYVANLEPCVYVLYSFTKKSHQGSKTDKHDQDMIAQRYKEAQVKHAEYLRSKKEEKSEH